LVNGELSIDSRPQQGTTVNANVPFRLNSDSALAAG
jgi:chemotaxis protein histidine kinase CheA